MKRVVACAMLAATIVVSGSPAGAADTVDVWITTADGTQKLAHSTTTTAAGGSKSRNIVRLGTALRQHMTGFGASITGASAANILALSDAEQARLFADLFDPIAGAGLNVLRQPMGSTDFNGTAGFFSYNDSASPDPGLTAFSIARDESAGILPLLRRAKAANSGLSVDAAPWSPPAWMKTNNSVLGGSLKPEYYPAYADYFVRFLQAYAAAGVPVSAVSTQNEPLFANSAYPSMSMTATEQANFIKVLDGTLTEAGLGTGIWAYDHNWDNTSYPTSVLKATTAIPRVLGAAFHCYGGSETAMSAIASLGKRVKVSECSGTDSSTVANTFGDSLLWQFGHLVVGAARNGSEGTTMWNVALDANGGPHQGYCGSRCNGLVEVANGTFTKNADYYVLAHASKFVDKGARYLDSTTKGVTAAVFVNPSGQRVVLVRNSSSSSVKYAITTGTATVNTTIPGRAIATIVW